MTIKLTNWFDTEEESGCCQMIIWNNVKYLDFENQITNGLWLRIWFKEGTEEYKKHNEMNGLLYYEYDPEHNQLEIIDAQ